MIHKSQAPTKLRLRIPYWNHHTVTLEEILHVFLHVLNDEADEDIANVPLDYGQSESTKALVRRIEFRWHMYCQVQRDEPSALPMWNNAEEALHQLTPDDVYRFLKFCLPLKRGQDRRRLKGVFKAYSLRADWRMFRCYYNKVTRTRISRQDILEINAMIRRQEAAVFSVLSQHCPVRSSAGAGMERVQPNSKTFSRDASKLLRVPHAQR
ncbi:hypothetical protein N7476_004786 [Penicillium atrosanguineum]|uniref:Uncharacterized protein n=1 Tax=Penicillium atrosanguineum TaxID=1132637 RepID=A0A9W9PY78_9EURO|nr:hypothetical protein N7476_004786 [Penicillium atrosanguineum]